MEAPSWMASVTHRMVKTNGINMHVVEQGDVTRPVVLLLHGFPEFWYSWRYQIPALAEAGFRVVVPDMRGYGQTDAPKSIEEYTSLHIVGDLLGLLDELDEKRVFVVAHDWGAIIAWDLCLFRPDRVQAAAILSVPFLPRTPRGSMLKMYGEVLGEGFYMCRFQEPGRAERDFEREGGKACVAKLLFPDIRRVLIAPKDKELMESIALPEKQPSWITDFDYQYYVENFEKRGWSASVNYYRCLDKSWELKAPWANVGVQSTVLFVAGDQDLTMKFPGMQEYMNEQFKKDVPNLKGIVLLKGGHFIQQEKPAELNEVLIKFLTEQAALASHPK